MQSHKLIALLGTEAAELLIAGNARVVLRDVAEVLKPPTLEYNMEPMIESSQLATSRKPWDQGRRKKPL